MKKKVAIVGRAGVGKTSLIRELRKLRPDVEFVEPIGRQDLSRYTCVVEVLLPGGGYLDIAHKHLHRIFVNHLPDIDSGIWAIRAESLLGWLKELLPAPVLPKSGMKLERILTRLANSKDCMTAWSTLASTLGRISPMNQSDLALVRAGVSSIEPNALDAKVARSVLLSLLDGAYFTSVEKNA